MNNDKVQVVKAAAARPERAGEKPVVTLKAATRDSAAYADVTIKNGVGGTVVHTKVVLLAD